MRGLGSVAGNEGVEARIEVEMIMGSEKLP